MDALGDRAAYPDADISRQRPDDGAAQPACGPAAAHVHPAHDPWRTAGDSGRSRRRLAFFGRCGDLRGHDGGHGRIGRRCVSLVR